MEVIRHPRGIQLLVLLVSLVILLSPCFCSALTSLNDDDLSGNSPSLVETKPENETDPRLQPINEKQLDALSPSLVAPADARIPEQESNQMMSLEFENSICFKRCHTTNDFYPSQNTAKQWRLLIEQGGHSIFSEIPWDTPNQKEDILNYLLHHAKNSKPESAGIGVW